ncbi:MAG: TIR domain-containing protein [Hyphomonadaceae bacterium]|nr:TIR domain-containing protein [Hyphomonadaceae bacterium]
MAQVFLSYASEDRDRVRPLAEALAAKGFSVWWDRSIAAGDDFSAVIQRELAAAKAVIVVWTNVSAQSAWVRDEAGRARDDGRLVPVMLDRIQIPLGFGAFQAEDFSRWNGAANAAQMQLLEEAVKAKLEGRSVDGAAIAAKRKRLASRIRVVSILTATAAVVGIGATVYNTFIRPQPTVVTDQRQDNMAEVLRLVREGKLTGDQAAEIIAQLENQTFAQTASLETSTPSVPPPASSAPGAQGETPPDATLSAPSDPNAPAATQGQQQVATEAVSTAEFEEAARSTFRSGLAELLASPDATVREAAVKLSDPATREEAFDTLWNYAGANPGEQQALIYRVCAAVAQAVDSPRAEQFVARATQENASNPNVWRMYSFNLRRQNRTQEAGAAGLVSQGLEAQERGDSAVAEQRLERALPQLRTANERTAVEGQLSRISPNRRFQRPSASQGTSDAPATEQTDGPQNGAAQTDEQKQRPRIIRRDRAVAAPQTTTTEKSGQ